MNPINLTIDELLSLLMVQDKYYLVRKTSMIYFYDIFTADGMSEDEAKQILSEHAEKYHVRGTTIKMSWFQKFIEYQVC